MSKVIKLKANITFSDLKEGGVYTVKVDAHGTPLEQVWRRRLRNAKHDGSLSEVPLSSKRANKKLEEKVNDDN